MVPDGAKQAIIRLANGSTVDARVEGNLLDVQVKHESAAVEREDASGQRAQARVAGTASSYG